jgi:hypothetical protein
MFPAKRKLAKPNRKRDDRKETSQPFHETPPITERFFKLTPRRQEIFSIFFLSNACGLLCNTPTAL